MNIGKTTEKIKRVALLATGDEVVNGDILNTNGQAMAQELFQHGIMVGSHLIVSDNQDEIEQGIHFLLTGHDALIITGGLGPTSDDCTRFALAKALDQPLEFDAPTWQRIQERFKQLNLKKQPDSNRNQALFPKIATIIPNSSGSASACWLRHKDKLIFMLPGPPRECLPIFNETVLPLLKKNNFSRDIIHKKWLLFSVSEGEIAEELDQLAAPHYITTGYRVCYPYVEFKAHAESKENMQTFFNAAEETINKHLINAESIPASEYLIQFLEGFNETISIDCYVSE